MLFDTKDIYLGRHSLVCLKQFFFQFLKNIVFVTKITSVTVKKGLVKTIVNLRIFGTLDISKDAHQLVTKGIFKCSGKPMKVMKSTVCVNQDLQIYLVNSLTAKD